MTTLLVACAAFRKLLFLLFFFVCVLPISSVMIVIQKHKSLEVEWL